MSVTKVSASIDEEVVREVKRLVGPRGVSAFLNEAAREKLQRQRITALLDRLDGEHGPVSPAERAKAKRELARILE